MRLIDADYLKNRLSLLENTATLTLGERCIMWRILEVINKMPTEAEPVKHERFCPQCGCKLGEGKTEES